METIYQQIGNRQTMNFVRTRSVKIPPFYEFIEVIILAGCWNTRKARDGAF